MEMQAAGPSSHSAESARTHNPDLCLYSDDIVGILNCILPSPFDTPHMTFLILEDCPLTSCGSTARGGSVMALERCQPWSCTEYLTKVRIKQGKLTFCERLRADFAEERSGVSVVLPAGIFRGYLGGWIHFDSIWAFRHIGDSIKPEQSAWRDARSFRKAVVRGDKA